MKFLKLLPIALFAITLAACGDDDEDENLDSTTGTFKTLANGMKYAEDKVNADVVLYKDAGTISIGIDRVTAKPASGGNPAKFLSNFTLKTIPLTVSGDKYFFEGDLDGDHAFGYMDGDVKPCHSCHIMGTLDGESLFFTMEYKFSSSPMEPTLSSTYKGVCQLKIVNG